jgi:Domain of unknown function (DUF4382)
MFKNIKLPAAMIFSSLLFAACGGDNAAQSGRVAISLTDAPACGYDAVNVTVEKIRIHQSGSATENDTGWKEIVLNPAKRVDLVKLTNGVLEPLGSTPLTQGKYTQLRLVLAENTAANPLLNSVVPTGKQEVALTTPSGSKSGEKLIHSFDVADGTLVDLVMDFDACKSIVARGNGAFNLKPVIAVVPKVVSGAITGFVDPAIANSIVTAQQAGKVVKATYPDATGKFTLGPVVAGTYDVTITADGRAAGVVTGVPVTAGITVKVSDNTTAAPAITLPASAAGAVSGNVTFSAAAPTDGAVVSARQTLTSGTVFEAKFINSNITTGAYTMSVPLDAPRVGAYGNGTLPLTLNADAAVAGKYALRASAAGYTTSPDSAVTVTGAGAVQNFTLNP